jgi:sugar phosphate isomerase/epimerase
MNISIAQTILLTGLLTATSVTAMNIPKDRLIGGFAVGTQAYSFNRFSAMEAIERTAQAGGTVIEFYPGQRFSLEQPETRWDHNATEEMIAAIEQHLEKHDVLAVNYGVVGIPNNEAEARRIFDFAKRLGLSGITTESADSLDVIEKLVKEYDIKVAFHNHPRRDNQPSYRMWDPVYLNDLVKDRDPRIGASADTGHWLRSGIEPVSALRILEGRIISLHLKDRADPASHDVIIGTGMGNMPGVLDELRRQEFSGNISIEYEHNWDDSIPDIAASIGFIRGYGVARGWE